MKNSTKLLLIAVLFGCSYKPNNKIPVEFQNNNSEILTSLYKFENDTVQIVRILNKDGNLSLKLGKIWMGDYALINQEFTSTIKIADKDSTQAKYEGEGFKSRLYNERDVMFIQIIPDSSMSNLEVLGFLNYRQEIEKKIDIALKQNNIGEWFAGDLGAGANMLFFIDNWDLAIKTVMAELLKEELMNHVIITKRLTIAPGDWTYEIVFPVEYEGTFNQM